MREWRIFTSVAVGALMWLTAAGVSAQTRRARGFQDEYQGGQYDQSDYGQGQQGQSYQRASQQPGGQRYYANRASGAGASGNYTDQQLASWLLVDNRGEIQLARVAQKRSSCDDVKDFAKMVIDDHAKLVEDLQQFAGMGQTRRQDYGDEEPSERGQSAQSNARGNPAYRPANMRSRENASYGGPQPGGLNIVRLKQQLGQQCLASAEQELEQKDGDELDKCYIGMQIAKHMEMLDTLKVFSRYASPQLDELIEQAEQTTQDHLDHAKHLIKKLDSDKNKSSQSSKDRDSRRNRSSDDDNK
ncbi:MAG TPA: DUF4142 domain-containing protein [Pirellulales bacterium]|nr:DUF4142 domain-containing protein [Pirellulales bacterium]